MTARNLPRMTALRSWVSVHDWRGSAAIFLGCLGLGILTRGGGFEEIGGIIFAQQLPYWMLIPAVLGIGLAGLIDYKGPRHLLEMKSQTRSLVGPRALWLGVGVVSSLGVLAGVLAFSPDADLRVGFLNLALFTGVSMIAVIIGIPHAAWLAPAALVLAAMAFGFPAYAASDEWYFWAMFLSMDASLVRTITSLIIFTVPAGLYILGVTRSARVTSG